MVVLTDCQKTSKQTTTKTKTKTKQAPHKRDLVLIFASQCPWQQESLLPYGVLEPSEEEKASHLLRKTRPPWHIQRRSNPGLLSHNPSSKVALQRKGHRSSPCLLSWSKPVAKSLCNHITPPPSLSCFLCFLSPSREAMLRAWQLQD